MREQVKTPEKELSDEEIVNLSDAEVKTLVIRMLTEIIEYGHKIKSRSDWKGVFNVMKSKDRQPRLLYPAKLSFRMEGQIKVLAR